MRSPKSGIAKAWPTATGGCLLNVVEQTFASSWGDKALLALGDLAFESGDFAAARWYWERIIPHPIDQQSPRPRPKTRQTPTTKTNDQRPTPSPHGPAIPIRSSIWPPSARGWCWLRFSKAIGRGPRTICWNSPGCTKTPAAGWPGGMSFSPRNLPSCLPKARSGRRSSKNPAGRPSPVRPREMRSRGKRSNRAESRGGCPCRSPRATRKTSWPTIRKRRLSYHPILTDDLTLVNTSREIFAVKTATGKPAFGQSAAIYRDPLDTSRCRRRRCPRSACRVTR